MELGEDKESEGTKGKLTDTLDLVVMGYYRGRGKRVSFGMGAFLVGLRKNGRFVTLAKVGTGLTDDQFKEMINRLKKLIVVEKPKEYEVDLYNLLLLLITRRLYEKS